MSLFFGEDVLFGKKGSRIIDSSDSSFTVKGSGENPDLEMKSDCIVISSSSNDEIEIFEDDEATAEEKNKATCDLQCYPFL
jgi:hypothetical protein